MCEDSGKIQIDCDVTKMETSDVATVKTYDVPYIFYEIIETLKNNSSYNFDIDVSTDAHSEFSTDSKDDIDLYEGHYLQSSIRKNLFHVNITSSVVELLEEELEFYEKVALCFLLYENENIEIAYQTIKLALKKLEVSGETSTFVPLSNWARTRELADDSKWKERFVEALCIIQNYKAVSKLGYKLEDVNMRFLPNNRYTSLEVDLMRKALYYVIESLTVDQAHQLIQLAIEDGKYQHYNINPYDANYMEVNLLHWNSIKYINFTYGVRDNIDVSRLVNHLKVLEEQDLAEYLKSIVKLYARRFRTQTSMYSESSSQESNFSITTGPMSIPHSEVSSYVQGATSSETSYKINPNSAGLCLIINQKEFYSDPHPDVKHLLPDHKLVVRHGTDLDRDRLKDVFECLGFEVISYGHSLTHFQIIEAIKFVTETYVKPEHSCFVLCILSHGKKNCVFGSNSIPVDIREIEHLLSGKKCPSLIKKPKILIIQACQGTPLQSVIEVEEDGPKKQGPYVEPVISNEIIFWSTIPGFASFRDVIDGTWFIKSLTNELILQKPGDDIFRVFTKVNNSLKSRYINRDGEKKAMMPIFNVTLTELLYLSFSARGKLDLIKRYLKRQLFYLLLKEYSNWQLKKGIVLRRR